MSEKPLANKSPPPSALADADYDIIFATVSETAQGRRFLEEYARRCRPAESEADLAAIEHMQAAIGHGGASERLDLLLEMADMAQTIVRMRAEILAIKPSGSGPFDAVEELNSIVQTTESATSNILTAAEQVQEIAWTMRESGLSMTVCDELDARATEIYTACSFQDLTGQRIRKVIQLLRYLEDRINSVVSAQGKTPAAMTMAAEPSLTSSSLVQAGVDAVMGQPIEGQENRQDATLEDISRLMLAIEPTIGSQQGDSSEAPDAALVRSAQDVRPELSVAATVRAEAEAEARGRAAPALPSQAAAAEPGLFVPEVMSQLVQTLRPAPLPPGDVVLRTKPMDPSAEDAQTSVAAARASDAGMKAAPPPQPGPDDFALAQPKDFLPPDVLQGLEAALRETAAEEPAPAAVAELKAGSVPDPALVTPATLPPPHAEPEQPKSAASHDPLAPLRAMSEAQKIALFS